MQPDSFVFSEHPVWRSEITAIAQARQTQLDIVHGPVFAADLFCHGSQEQTLLLSAHHLVVDLVLWRIIWHNMDQILRGSQPLSPRSTVSFQAFVERLHATATSLVPSEILPYEVDTSDYRYWGVEVSDNTSDQSESHAVSLEPDVTALLLGQSSQPLATSVTDILVAALVYSFG
ncbi:hypothetical protein BDW74DRAFT_171945 [Aspergillus multicolor]|uniref:uncharacterized protein n=1 Tax=Aspergillus multicolor TaxID=41759 RepID=UPI003CCDBEBF